jgi:hypothetical protein
MFSTEQRIRRNYLPYRLVPAVEARQFRDREHPIAPATVAQAIDLKTEARQFMERTGKDGGSLGARDMT